MSIKESWEKIKGAWKPEVLLDRNAFVALILALTAVFSFALGRISGMEEKRSPVQILFSGTASVTPALPAAATLSLPTMKGKYVGSRGGDKYHLPWCSGARRIKDVNQIWFTSKEEAEKAGYAPAANCKGI